MRDSNTITGTVIGVCNCGTLVVVYLEDDGRVVPIPVEHRAFQWLLDGYRQGAELPADHEQHIAFYGLLIGVRRLARSLRVRPAAVEYHKLMAGAVRRELDWLR